MVILRHEPQQNNPHSVVRRHGPLAARPVPPQGLECLRARRGGRDLLSPTTSTCKRSSATCATRWQAAVDRDRRRRTRSSRRSRSLGRRPAKQHEVLVGKLADDVKQLADELTEADDPLLPFDGRRRRRWRGAQLSGPGLPPQAARAGDRGGDRQVPGRSSKPRSTKAPRRRASELTGWQAVGETSIERQEAEVKNVVGVLEGEGPHADETIVIGAHYDHLGLGGAGSAAPGVHEIHNGADDNGSGTTVLHRSRPAAGRPRQSRRGGSCSSPSPAKNAA